MYFGRFCFRGEIGFLNYYDICMCVVNKQFELLEFVFDSVYADLQYDEIFLTFTAGSVYLCGLCGHHWSFCEVVFVPYVEEVTVMHVLLFVLHVCMLRVCEGDGNVGVGDGRCVVAESAGYEWYTWFRCCD